MGWEKQAETFIAQDEIKVWKATKKSEKEVDIKPMIYKFEIRENSVYMLIATGSVENLKPELVMEALAVYLGIEKENVSFAHHRLEVYANAGTEDEKKFVSLESLGKKIEA